MSFFFFFKQKTAYEMRISDWSSDVCSSDLSPPNSARIVANQGPGPQRSIVAGLGFCQSFLANPETQKFPDADRTADERIRTKTWADRRKGGVRIGAPPQGRQSSGGRRSSGRPVAICCLQFSTHRNRSRTR